MGCHTTFYKPANLTYEQARELAIAELNQRLLSNEKYMSTRFKLCNGEVKNPEEIELKICIYLSKFYKRWIKRIESNNPIWKAAVWKFQKENLFPNNNNFYLRLEDFHDCFRVGWDLGDRQLTSLKETLEPVQLEARMKLLELLKANKINPLLASAFEDSLYTRFKPGME